jgi:hypothetical protein
MDSHPEHAPRNIPMFQKKRRRMGEALVQALQDPEISEHWQIYLQALAGELTIALDHPEQEFALRAYSQSLLDEVISLIHQRAHELAKVSGRFLGEHLRWFAEYQCTGEVPEWKPRRISQLPDKPCVILPDGGLYAPDARAVEPNTTLLNPL